MIIYQVNLARVFFKVNKWPGLSVKPWSFGSHIVWLSWSRLVQKEVKEWITRNHVPSMIAEKLSFKVFGVSPMSHRYAIREKGFMWKGFYKCPWENLCPEIFRLRGVNVVVVKLPKTLNPENQLANFGDSLFLGVHQNVDSLFVSGVKLCYNIDKWHRPNLWLLCCEVAKAHWFLQ